MPGAHYSTDLKDRIHHLSSMEFSAQEISTLLAVPIDTVYRTLRTKPGMFSESERTTGRHRKLSRADIEVCRNGRPLVAAS